MEEKGRNRMSEHRAGIGYVRHLREIPRIADKEPAPHFDRPLTIWQGPVFRNLNKLSSNPQWAFNFLQCFVPIRDQAITLLQALLANGVVHLGGEYQHLQDHWFDDQKGWWPGERVEEKMTLALEDAFIKVNNTGLPLQCYWLIYDPYAHLSAEDRVFFRISDPVKSLSAHGQGTYQDNGFYSILFEFCAPALESWIS
jgi:hypothetical protein